MWVPSIKPTTWRKIGNFFKSIDMFSYIIYWHREGKICQKISHSGLLWPHPRFPLLLIYHSKTAIHSYGRNPQLQDAKVNGHALGYRYSITYSGVFFRYFRANFVHYGLKSPFANSKMKVKNNVRCERKAIMRVVMLLWYDRFSYLFLHLAKSRFTIALS